MRCARALVVARAAVCTIGCERDARKRIGAVGLPGTRALARAAAANLGRVTDFAAAAAVARAIPGVDASVCVVAECLATAGTSASGAILRGFADFRACSTIVHIAISIDAGVLGGAIRGGAERTLAYPGRANFA